MQSYEVEVKALLGTAERADEVRKALYALDPACYLHSKNNQLNHYFKGDDLFALVRNVEGLLSQDSWGRLKDLVAKARSFSVRTRYRESVVILVVKASVDDTTSENGIQRMEFEAPVTASLQQLDDIILKSGFTYLAKWSREREEYVCLGTNVTLDKNAGYGWLAEFERVVENINQIDAARAEVRDLMTKLGVEELPQDRLERMFAYYNEHWPEYYGTDKVFVVE